MYPGKDQMTYYFCLGKMPQQLIGAQVKSNPSINIWILIASVCHTVTYFHIRFLKKDFSTPSGAQSPSSVASIIHRSLSTENLFRFESLVLV